MNVNNDYSNNLWKLMANNNTSEKKNIKELSEQTFMDTDKKPFNKRWWKSWLISNIKAHCWFDCHSAIRATGARFLG